jgi:hypothetical protein
MRKDSWFDARANRMSYGEVTLIEVVEVILQLDLKSIL